jgi:DNA-binding NarL/FixJ family response regulator
MNRPRVLIADDHTLVAEAIQKLIENECEVVGIVADGRKLLQAARCAKPDLVILDLGMPQLNGLDAAEQLRQVLSRVKFLILTMNADVQVAVEALRCGASGYLLKSSTGSELVRAIREVLRGGTYVTPTIARALRDEWVQDPNMKSDHRLTPRQREVLQLLAEGQTMKEVAATLQISTRTVAFHKYRIMADFRLRSNAQIVQLAIKEHMLLNEDLGEGRSKKHRQVGHGPETASSVVPNVA